jgi:hypothetical protein
MRTLSRKESFPASPQQVFTTIDDLGVTGMHMTKSSTMMMGSKLNLQFLSPHKSGVGSRYRWSGKMMGLTMDFTVEVKKWVDGKEKVWETIGPTKLIIYSWYRMMLNVKPAGEKSEATLSIAYEKPKGLFNRILCFLVADWYCRWCLRQMLGDARKKLEAQRTPRAMTHTDE